MTAFIRCVVQVVFVVLMGVPIEGWKEGPGSVLLRDVTALTLHRGRYSTGRHSSPVLQLRCAGGSAGCEAFVPEVVQCENKGWDGDDAQWECKTDMDSRYRFGRVEVSCEGYSHPDDPHVLKGSCGLVYTLELRRAHASFRERLLKFFSDLAVIVLGAAMALIVICVICKYHKKWPWLVRWLGYAGKMCDVSQKNGNKEPSPSGFKGFHPGDAAAGTYIASGSLRSPSLRLRHDEEVGSAPTPSPQKPK